MVAKHSYGVLKEWRYLNLEVPDITQGSPVAMVFPRCFLFHGTESLQVHIKIEQKIFCIEKVLPITSTSEILRDTNELTSFVTKQKKIPNNLMLDIPDTRFFLTPHT